MKYIIMADGKARRWGEYQGIHKYQIRFGRQTLLERTCTLVRKLDPDAQICITSHDPSLTIEGAVRHEPEHNELEVDRFTAELIDQDVCFLYGDVLYTRHAMQTIVNTATTGVLFFGSAKKIFAVKVADAELFRHHIANVRQQYLSGKIHECIGWEVYHSLQGLPLESREVGGNYVLIDDDTRDFNTPDDLISYQKEKGTETVEDIV